jgi:hypothetical protein
MIGLKFGRLTVLRLVDPHIRADGRTTRQFAVRCDCGVEKIVRGEVLRAGQTLSCGCAGSRATIGERLRKHGESQAGAQRIVPEYTAWKNMHQRCMNPSCREFKYYGARGITICERWSIYENFLTDMGRRPSAKHSIDRINNDGNYEPGNCHWATRSEQMKNRRPFKRAA